MTDMHRFDPSIRLYPCRFLESVLNVSCNSGGNKARKHFSVAPRRCFNVMKTVSAKHPREEKRTCLFQRVSSISSSRQPLSLSLSLSLSFCLSLALALKRNFTGGIKRFSFSRKNAAYFYFSSLPFGIYFASDEMRILEGPEVGSTRITVKIKIKRGSLPLS